MKKQGPPEPLSEEHFANLKRKKGLPVDDPPAEASTNKRRRTSKKPTKPTPAPKNGIKKVANGKDGLKSALRSTKPPSPESDDEIDDEFDDADLEMDDDDDDEDAIVEKLGDDFMDSGSSVYDSDEEGAKKKFVFSDDEDEDEEEREEKLTAANIEGLSRKLDQELEDEAAENEAELREDALQTNIAGDKPEIFGGEEEDELSAKTKSLLAPDLQLLRTRITETIRVLDDFSKLSEEGRSRAEYTSQLLKDFCACMFGTPMVNFGSSSIRGALAPEAPLNKLFANCWFADYGYNEFLAAKLMYALKSAGPLRAWMC